MDLWNSVYISLFSTSKFSFTVLHILLTYGAEPFFRSRQLCSHSRTFQNFIEPEGSLLCSQEPSTGPYPKPDRSSPYNPIRSLSKIYFNTVRSTYLYTGIFQVCYLGLLIILWLFLFPICSTTKIIFLGCVKEVRTTKS
jgi:hypothetical protein